MPSLVCGHSRCRTYTVNMSGPTGDEQPKIGTGQEMPAEVRAILAASFVVRFTIKGRRSGLMRTTETTYVWDGAGRIYISGYPGRRDWVANAAANAVVAVHTVEGPRSYEIPARARVILDRGERIPHLLAFIDHWAARPGAPGGLFGLVLTLVRLNRRLRLPWWGPFYLVRRVLDQMPCVELTFDGPPSFRRNGPPSPRGARHR